MQEILIQHETSTPRPNLRWQLIAVLCAGLTAWSWYRAGEAVGLFVGAIGFVATVHGFFSARGQPLFPKGITIILISLSIFAIPYASWRYWQHVQLNQLQLQRDRLQSMVEVIEHAGGQAMSGDPRRIQFIGPSVTSKSLATVTGLKDTEWLSVHSAPIDDHALSAIREWDRLKYLSLAYSSVSDDGLVHIKELKNLEVVELFSNGITDAGLVHLENLPRLKKVHIQSDNVTRAGAAALQEALPGCSVVVEPMPSDAPSLTTRQVPDLSNPNAKQ